MSPRLHRRRASRASASPSIFCVGGCLLIFFVYWQQRPVQQDDDYFVKKTPQNEMALLRKDADDESGETRASGIQIILAHVSSLALLRDRSAPQYNAFSWLVDKDNRQLQVDNPDLVQRYIMALLWFSTGGSNWKESTSLGWLSSTHECDWKKMDSGGIGVVSCNEQMQATKLDLVKNNLQGSMPSEIRYLSRLESLDMKDNALTGALPEELGYLTTLQYVALSSNRFEGKIPSTLGGVDHLEQLLLHENDFTGTVSEALCDLKKQARLFNIWTDCNGSNLVCSCCTVCCQQGGGCQPVKK